jgi:hypothetical protein
MEENEKDVLRSTLLEKAGDIEIMASEISALKSIYKAEAAKWQAEVCMYVCVYVYVGLYVREYIRVVYMHISMYTCIRIRTVVLDLNLKITYVLKATLHQSTLHMYACVHVHICPD